jgi:tetratricopeptide (TPR) repeat protein
MAKRCEICNRQHPEHEPDCPHYQAHVHQVGDSDIFAELAEEPGDKGPGHDSDPGTLRPKESDSAVHLDVVEEVSASPSGEPLEAWQEAEAAEPGPDDLIAVVEQDAAAEPLDVEEVHEGPAAEVQAVGAEDLVHVMEEEPPSPGPAEEAPTVTASAEATATEATEAVEAPGAKPTKLAGRTGQPTQLAGQSPMPTMLAPADHGEQETAAAGAFPDLTLDSGKSASEAATITPDEFELPRPADALDVTEQIEDGVGLVETSPEALQATEAMDLADVDKGAKGPDSGALDVVEAAEEATLAPESGDALLESASAVDLGAPLSRTGPVSGLDPIAEALESDVELGQEEAAEAGVEDALEAVGGTESGESSAVDLGATVPMPGEEGLSSEKKFDDLETTAAFDQGAEAGSGKDLLSDEAAEAAEEVAADDLLAGVTDKSAAVGEEASEVAEAASEEDDMATLAAKDKKGRRAPALDEEEVKRKPPKPRYGRRWLAGTAVGILLAVGGVAALRYFDPDLLDAAIKEVPTSKPQKDVAAKKVVQGPAATPVQQALALMHEGKLDEAWKLVKDTGDSPEALSARAEVGWLRYLRDQKAGKKPNKADIEASVNDLKKVKDKNITAELLHGLVMKTDIPGQKKEVGQVEKDVRDLLLKSQVITKGDEDLLTAISQVLAGKKKEEERLADLAKALVAAKLLDSPDKLDAKAIQALARDLGQTTKFVAEIEKLVEAKKGEAIKKVEELLEARKNLDDKLAQVNEALKNAKVKEGPQGVAELVKSRDAILAERTALTGALVKALTELGQPAPKAIGDLGKQLVESVIAVREKARSPVVTALGQVVSSLGGVGAETGGILRAALDRAAVESQLRLYQVREPLIQTPEQKLDTWIALFQDRDRKGGNDADAARDARWVRSKEAKASPEARAKAYYLEGLLARSQGKFEEAGKALDEAVKSGQAIKGLPWLAQASQALRELRDPSAYYLPRAEMLHNEGRLQAALAILNNGLKAMPDNGRLLGLRALVNVELAASPKQLKEVEKQVRADAKRAQDDTAAAAAGFYALGRLEEDLGRLVQAEQDYRQALKVNKGGLAEANRYRLALARLLQREAPAAEATPAPAKGGAAGEESEEDEGEQVRISQPLATMLLLAVTGFQAPGDDDEENPAAAARLKESIDLAQTLIKSEDPKTKGQGHILLGLAYSRQGKRTEGINEYLKGLSLVHPGRESKELLKLIEDHPAFQQPDRRSQPSAQIAEAYFGKGLTLYWARKYARAEDELRKAVEFFGNDARYHYFLGLARLAQGGKSKREAARFEFEVGARLEAENRPSSTAVNGTLERIQGPLRRYLDGFRQKAVVAGG